MTPVTLFPLWAVALSAFAFVVPGPFVAAREAIVPLLAIVMLGMGMTLVPRDFVAVFRRPALVGVGLLLQYTVMPIAALVVAKLFGLTPEETVGMVLVGASSGGTASNVIAYLARANVALSVALTASSTLLAVIALPAITLALVGRTVPVPAFEMLTTVAQVALGPVLLGMLLRRLLARRMAAIQPWLPVVSVAAICTIIAIIVALNRGMLASAGALLLVAVAAHNAIGLLGGYWGARLLGGDRTSARTIAIEVGMQNSGLAVALAVKYFSAASALPGALFSIWHNLSGAALASWWARREETSASG
ncbi:MAG TPA: bile acid:sodium symporter family protein [Steroidobacteraceae bacterium]|nr:bile acid:sodium symporter family protein [Steroidobacteraceae bacterium]